MKIIFNTLLLVIFNLTLFAQTGVIKGRIVNGVNAEPIPFANVAIQGTNKGATCDANGYYVIADLIPGQYNLEASSIGFKKETIFQVQVTNARPAIADFSLQEESRQLDAVEIDAESTFYKPDESPLSLRTIGPTEVRQTPGGNRDISKVVRSLPGVASPPSFRNDIIIRGGAPSENTFYLDGIQIPVINHFQTQGSSGGPVGIINVDLLKEVNFYSGAFPASRGNTLSSIFDFKLKDGRQDKWTFNGVVGATDLGVTFEGPVTNNSSLVLSARRSYLKFLFDLFNLPFLPVYNDLQFKYKVNINDRSKITLIGIGAIDDFSLNLDAPEQASSPEEKEEAEYILNILPVSTQWNYTTGLKYEHFRKNGATSLFLSTNTLNNEAIKFRNNDFGNKANLLQDYMSRETELRARLEDYFTVKDWGFNYGVNADHAIVKTSDLNRVVTQTGLVERDYTSTLRLNKFGFFAQASTKLMTDKLTPSFGVRLDASDYSEATRNPFDQISPRFSVSYKLTEAISANLNTGIYYQLPPYTVLGYRDSQTGTLVNRENDVSFIESKHVVSGLEFNLKRNARITLEGFYKKYDRYPFLLEDSISLANLGADFGIIGNAPVVSSSEDAVMALSFLFNKNYLTDSMVCYPIHG